MFLDRETYYNFLELAHQTKIKKHQIMMQNCGPNPQIVCRTLQNLGILAVFFLLCGFYRLQYDSAAIAPR